MSPAPSARQPGGLTLAALLACLALSACGDDDDGTGPDAAGATSDAAATPDAAARRGLTCEPATASTEELCSCMAAIVCDQIYFCLDAEELAAKPVYWRPHSRCVAELESDCLEDAPDPEYLPASFPVCVAALAAETCAEFGGFDSVSRDFPASCENLRALDTGLGIQL